MAVEKSGSKSDVIVKLVLVFFVCLLSFSIGTFVGKKFSDNQHKLAKFEPTESAERDVASVDPHAAEVKPTDALTDDEVAKLAEEFVTDEVGATASSAEGHGTTDKNAHGGGHAEEASAHGAEHGAPAKTASAGHGEPAHGNEHGSAGNERAKAAPAHGAAASAHGAVSAAPAVSGHTVEPLKAAQRVARNEAAVRNEKNSVNSASRIPSSLPKEISASAAGKFTVQVASYPEEAEAQKMASDLKGKGFSAFYVSAKVKDRKSNSEKTWYRVSVGLFATAKEADGYKADLLARSKVTSAIVQKIVE